MFTGIIQATGTIAAVEKEQRDVRLRITEAETLLSRLASGDSVAVSGVCLTAVEVSGEGVAVDVSAETLEDTTLGDLRTGDTVNLEPALTLSTPLGGHLVSGHVDGVGTVSGIEDAGRSLHLTVQAPAALSKYIAVKGSICIDGVSLTVNDIQGDEFGVNIIPHTRQATTVRRYTVGTRVNLEVDLIARYLERLALGDR